MIKLRGPYLRITSRSRSERRSLLPLENFGEEFSGLTNRYRTRKPEDNKVPLRNKSSHQNREDSEIVQYM